MQDPSLADYEAKGNLRTSDVLSLKLSRVGEVQWHIQGGWGVLEHPPQAE